MKTVEQAIDKLANAMRIFAEASATFDRLKKIDIQEAIDK
jgi:hypothetical protein